MSADKTFLGRRMMDFSSSPAFQPFSRVTLWVDDNNCYTAGDDSGRTLEADCPWATQEICNDILARVNGYKYVPYTATDAILDPAAEIGDGATVNGRYSVLASIEATFDPMFTATAEAPADEEMDHEFPYKPSTTRNFDRKIAQTRAEITVKADEIMAKVEEELNGLSSSIDVKLDGITLETIGADGKVSSVKLFDTGKIDLTGYATFTGLSEGTTTINGGCITTGTIKADYIKLGGDLTVYRRTSSSTVGGYLGYASSTLGDYAGIHIMSSDSENEVRATNYGVAMTSGTESYERAEISCVSGSIENLASVYVYADYFRPQEDDECSLGSSRRRWDSIWSTTSSISTSDRKEKKDISYDMSEYSQLFDCLKPCNFRFINGKSGRKHTGFIAQDIMEELEQVGVPTQDFACFIKDIEDGETQYGLRYEELIALCVAEIQRLKTRVKLMEA